MSLVLSPATEARVLQQVATGRYAALDDLLNHALDLLEAERTGEAATTQAMNDWLLRNKAAINTALDESFAAKERGESYSPEEAEVLLAAHRAARLNKAA
jgi:Arc/MetJ-type ribon-helix-helix transcriptional regulator